MVFTAITGIRDGALVSLKLRHFDIDRRLVLQNPLEVNTKFGKRIDTFLFPLNDAFEPIFLEWVRYLREDQVFADHDPLFPQTALGQDENNCFKAAGLTLCDKAGTASMLASAKTVAAVEKLAKSDRRLAATVDQWDADPWVLNTPARRSTGRGFYGLHITREDNSGAY